MIDEEKDEPSALTEEAFIIVRTAVVRPVCILQVPDGPLVPRQEVFDLEPRGRVAAGLRAEPRCDLEAAVCDSVVPRAKPGPIPEALLPAPLLEDVGGAHTRGQSGL